MQVYLDLVRKIIDEGVRKPSRTRVDTISLFAAHYQVDLAEGYPLLTTKKMNFAAIIHELLWYLSGEDHIRNLRQYTKIWDAWADADGNLESPYGYFWRRFPSASREEPPPTKLPPTVPGRVGPTEPGRAAPIPSNTQWRVREVDQIRHVIDTLKRDPNSRRMVVSAWEPGNAIASRLPPCHYTFAFHVGDGKLNCHLTQRSGDIAIGIPFNLAAYAALTQIIAQESGLALGRFAHTIVDAHIYVAERGRPMAEYDHLEGLLRQLERRPKPLPKLVVARKPIDDLGFEDFQLVCYECDEAIKFKVAV